MIFLVTDIYLDTRYYNDKKEKSFISFINKNDDGSQDVLLTVSITNRHIQVFNIYTCFRAVYCLKVEVMTLSQSQNIKL